MGRLRRDGWDRLSDAGKKLAGHWRHDSGWEIRHCGHPTANWPYYATSPEHDLMVVSHNGLGFWRLTDAMAQVEAAIEGRLRMVRVLAKKHGAVYCLRPTVNVKREVVS